MNHIQASLPSLKKFVVFITLLCAFLPCGFLRADDTAPAAEKKQEKTEVISEAVTVIGKAPRELPFSTVSQIDLERIKLISPRDLSDTLSFTSGTFVSTGTKNEPGVKIRGLDSSRITLLYDGVPVYEPFYNTFDLKSVQAESIAQINVVKGASSVLYGPNSMGGIVDIQTRRPAPPQFNLKATYGSQNTYAITPVASLQFGDFVTALALTREKSDGFAIATAGANAARDNSDYNRTNLTAKVYYYPLQSGELLAEFNYYTSAYGIPAALNFGNPKYWRFPDWDRYMGMLGGVFPLLGAGDIRFRAYYLNYHNVLDFYKNGTYADSAITSVSTYNNYTYGAFVLGAMPLFPNHTLRASLNGRVDHVERQDNTGLPWNINQHSSLSAGIEDEWKLGEQWSLMGGLSLDYLHKDNGSGESKLNPLLGVKYSPETNLSFHATVSQKSHFPSMKNLYALPANGGNPNLQDELAQNYELGFAWNTAIRIDGAVFYNRILDMIDKSYLSDKTYIMANIGRADISGFELDLGYNHYGVNATLGYTYLYAKNLDTHQPLDLTPHSQLNATIDVNVADLCNVTLWGLAVSQTQVLSGKTTTLIDGYTLANAAVAKTLGQLRLFVKLENIFNAAYVTEPGFPMRARTITAGFEIALANLR